MTDILLVDDSPLDRQLFSELLGREQDFDVRCCENGEAAIRAMEHDPPDIVLTDMQMPIMDGLELVKQIRTRFAQIPVILITGQGSEELAKQALRAGAASYVPKSQSAETMAATIRHVIELDKTSLVDERINALTTLVQYELELQNDESLIPGLLQLVRQRLSECTALDSVSILRVEVALEHAVLNAIYHGNLEFGRVSGVEFDAHSRVREAKIRNSELPYRDRRVSVIMRITPAEVRFVVRDEGSGFDVKEVTSIGLSHSLRGEAGQGLYLMWAFMDKVAFERSGTVVNLAKLLPQPKFDEPATSTEPTQETSEPEEQVVAEEVKLTLKELESGRVHELTKSRATIGRDPSCDLVINSTAVSFHHCLLFLHEGWWFVRDLKSKNGVKVNGISRDSHLLPPTGTLSVGRHEFKASYEPHKLGGVGITPPVNPF